MCVWELVQPTPSYNKMCNCRSQRLCCYYCCMNILFYFNIFFYLFLKFCFKNEISFNSFSFFLLLLFLAQTHFKLKIIYTKKYLYYFFFSIFFIINVELQCLYLVCLYVFLYIFVVKLHLATFKCWTHGFLPRDFDSCTFQKDINFPKVLFFRFICLFICLLQNK